MGWCLRDWHRFDRLGVSGVAGRRQTLFDAVRLAVPSIKRRLESSTTMIMDAYAVTAHSYSQTQPEEPQSLWPRAELDSMYESDFLDADVYNPDTDHSPLTSAGHPSPYLTNAEEFLGTGLFGSPAFFVQPPTRANTILSPPLGGDFRFQFKGSPDSSIGDDHEYLLGRSRTHSRASSISSSHTHHYTGASASPVIPPDVPELSPHIADLHNLQLVDTWGFHMSASTSNGSDSNVPSPHPKPQSPPALLIPDTATDPTASLFEASQPGLVPPPALGVIPATPITPPNQPKLGFQEILGQQVARRRAACESASARPPPTDHITAPLVSHPSDGEQATPPEPWSMPALDLRPGLGVFTTRSRSHSDPPSSQWGAALPAAIRPSPTHGQGPQPPSIPPGMLGTRVPDINVGVGGSVWDNAIDPILGTLGPAVHRARSVGDAHGNRRGHIRNARSDDMSSAYRIPDLPFMVDGSLAPPAISVPSSVPELDEGGVGPKRRHERSNSASRPSPYHSPHHSPRLLPDDPAYGGITLTRPVERVHVTTPATREASSNRRTAQANFKCPVPGCGSTFTRHFNLRGASFTVAIPI